MSFLQASKNEALHDNDQSLKKILDDSKVQKCYNESMVKSKE